MSYFTWCIIGMIAAVLVMIFHAKLFGGVLKAFFIIGGIAAFIFFLLCAIALCV